MHVSWLIFLRSPRSRFRGGWLPSLVLAGLALGSAARADYTVTVNPGTAYGTWEGWGCSLCWWANVFGTRADLANLVFTTNYTVLNGENLPGLGMNIARYNAGGCTPNTISGAGAMVASANIPAWRQMAGFQLDWFNAAPTSASWNWAADANQRAMLLAAKARGANWFELFSNSPLWWMCYNHNPSGAADGSNNLQSWNYDAHAAYLATIAAQAATNWGVTFNSVEAFNEPSANWWTATGTQEGCHVDAAVQATVIPYLATELAARGLTNSMVAASDENTYDGATSTWNSFSASVQAQVGKVNTHGYQYGGGRRDLLYTAVVGKRLWNSEYGESDATGMSLASNLHLDFTWLHPTAWCYWQPFDSGGWGLIQSNPGDNWIGNSNPKYHVLAQYTRHIRPGMTILGTGDNNTVAAYDPAGRKLVVVSVNYGTAQTISYNLGNFAYVGGPVKRWTTQPSGTLRYAAAAAPGVAGRAFSTGYLTNNIQTFEISNVDLAAPAAPAGLQAGAGIGRVAVAWKGVVGATSYTLLRGLSPTGLFTPLATQSGTNYTDFAPGGITYFYEVQAGNGAGVGPLTAPVAATPAAPPTLKAVPPGGKTPLSLTWPGWATNFTLYGTTNPASPASWSAITNPVSGTGGMWSVTLPVTAGNRYFRLGSP